MSYRTEREFRLQGKESIIVDQFDNIAVAISPVNVETTGLGPCIGIIVYDPNKKTALVGHITSPTDQYYLLMQLAVEIDNLSSLEELRVYIGGGGIEEPESIALTEKERAYTLQFLKGLGFDESQFTVKWNELHQSALMSIDTETGTVDFGIEENEYYLEDITDNTNIL